MDAEDTGSGKEDEPEQEVNSEQEDDDGAGPSTSAGGNSTSSNRQQRNIAEKMRRDKLNFFINELSTLVPIISFSPKKLDKTSILRLAATYIRLHNVVFGSPRRESRSSSQRQMLEYLPQYLASFNWSENVLEDMEGMLMIVNGAGRIIFISHTVEKLLGHTQIELMGQSLYNLTCLEDYDELKKNLAPNKDPNSTVVSGDTGDESSSDSVSISVPTPPSNVTTSSDQEQRQRRSFFVRLKQRAQSRGDQPQYVLVHVVGHLRVPQPSARRPNQPPNHNDVILVAVVKPFQEKRFTTLSLMEACREEFITRHTLDGRIIYTDHRISIVAGYLSEEVCGVPGFQYMHKEDFRWTMIGLRQMFFRGSSYGQSCYRLQTKNGSFIYLKTCGYLELSENNDSFQSLICINSLVSSAEGEALIRKMKEQYFPMIKNKEDVNMEMLSSNIQEIGNGDDGETVDQGEMQAAIGQMISNLPTPSPLSSGLASPCSSSMDPDPQLAKAMLLMKTLPPSCTQAMNIGIDPMIIKTSSSSVAASLSPPTSHHSPSPQPQPQQNRPSVLRMKRMRTDEQGQSQEVVTVSPRSVVVSPPLSRGKRKSSEEGEWSPVTPTPTTLTTITNIAPPLSPHFSLDSVLLNGEDIENSLLNITDINMIPGDEESPPSLVSNLEQEVDMYLSWGQSELTEELESSQVMEVLDSRLSLQDEQMQKIQQELEQVSQSPQALNSRLNQLQVEHRKQQQLLKTLQQDHLCSGQQDINV